MNSDSTSREERVNEAVATYLEAVEQGKPPDPHEWIAKHSDVATELESFFSARERFERAAGPREAAPSPHSAPTLDVQPAPREGRPGTQEESPAENRLFGDYELLEEIARGGMGVVFKARQVRLDRMVALKMILAGRLATAGDVERFEREARMAAALQHPNIVAIHEVGERQGQHYFSMDFIEGRSLAARVREHPLPSAEAARCVRTIARAIAYAHERGVLHRDLKPSNILLDTSGEPHVADFGLARRLAEDSGLTATGAVVGTPSYMSPEQALPSRSVAPSCSAKGERTPLAEREGYVGPASDVYSLGAILYEVVTGRPPFQAATTFDILRQVLETDPVAPRVLVPTLPRDLETIILKCLDKDPARRYASAQALAEDLDAFLEDRPIQARRPGLIERGLRWTWRRRRTLAHAATVAVLSVILAMGGWTAWSHYADAKLGRITFGGEPGLSAEVLDAAGTEVIVPRFALPRELPVKLPASDYLVHLTGKGRVSETSQLHVLAASQQNLTLELASGWKTPDKDEVTCELVDFGERHGVVAWDRFRQRLKRVDVFGGWDNPAWEVVLQNDLFTEGTRPYGFTKEMHQVFSANDPPRLLRPATDLDGDGVTDLLWTAWGRDGVTGLVALSGASGRPLWHAEPAPPLPPKGPPGKQRFRHGHGTQVFDPILVLDGEDGPDLLCAVHSHQVLAYPEGKDWAKDHLDLGRVCWLQSLSGKKGASRWTLSLPLAWFEKDAAKPTLTLVKNRDGRSVALVVAGHRLAAVDPRNGEILWTKDLGDAPGEPRLVSPAGSGQPDFVLCQTKTALHGLALLDGEPVWPRRQPLAAHETYLREPEILVHQEKSHLLMLVERGGKIALSLYDPAGDRRVWQREVTARWKKPEAVNPVIAWIPQGLLADTVFPELPAWPLLVDLDSGALPAVVVPHREANGEWVGIEVIDAAAGTTRWRQRWRSTSSSSIRQPDRFVGGPDLDGDGVRELFVASFGLKRLHEKMQSTLLGKFVGEADKSEFLQDLIVEAYSGKDGRRLWLSRQAIPHRSDSKIGPLRWWQAGPDGWPQLAIPCDKTVYVLTASTGLFAHRVPDLASPSVGDLDGDGLADLFDVERRRPGHGWVVATTQRILAFRGEPGQLWRRFGSWDVAADMNSDGIADLVGTSGEQTLAISGSDGSILWRHAAKRDAFRAPWPHADLDGDGVADLLGGTEPTAASLRGRADFSFAKRHAVSGKTGSLLWDHSTEKGKDPLLGNADGTAFNRDRVASPECHDLHGNGKGVVLYPFGALYLMKQEGSKKIDAAKEIAGVLADAMEPKARELCLAAVAGEDGRILWKQVIARWKVEDRFHNKDSLHFQVLDVDGDGAKEVLCIVEAPGLPREMQIRKGSDGSIVWKLPLPAFHPENDSHPEPVVLNGDLDGDSRAEIYLVDRWFESLKRDATTQHYKVGKNAWRVRVLRGADGKELWTWRSAERPPSTKSNLNFWWTKAALARLEGNGPALCLSFGERQNPNGKDEATFVVLAPGGTVRQQIVENESVDSNITVEAHDLDNDSHDELLWRLDPRKLLATRGGFERGRALWTDSIPWFTAVDRPGNGQAALVRRETILLDGRTGKKLIELPFHGALLPVDGKVGPPRFVASHGQVCRLLPTVTEDGRISNFSGKARTYDLEPHDPRLVRPFPWVEGRKYRPVLEAMAPAVLWIVAPGALALVALRRRSRTWWFVLGGYLAFAGWAWWAGWLVAAPRVSLTASSFEELFEILDELAVQGIGRQLGPSLAWLDSALSPLSFDKEHRFARMAFGLPLALFAAALLTWLLGQRWRRLATLCGVTVVVAAVLAGIDIHLSGETLDASESFHWKGWLVLLIPGAYWVGLLLLAAIFVAGVTQVARLGWRIAGRRRVTSS